MTCTVLSDDWGPVHLWVMLEGGWLFRFEPGWKIKWCQIYWAWSWCPTLHSLLEWIQMWIRGVSLSFLSESAGLLCWSGGYYGNQDKAWPGFRKYRYLGWSPSSTLDDLCGRSYSLTWESSTILLWPRLFIRPPHLPPNMDFVSQHDITTLFPFSPDVVMTMTIRCCVVYSFRSKYTTDDLNSCLFDWFKKSVIYRHT